MGDAAVGVGVGVGVGVLSGKSKTGGSFGLFGSLGSKAPSWGGETSVDEVSTKSGGGFIEVSVDGFTEGGFTEVVDVGVGVGVDVGVDVGVGVDVDDFDPLSTDGFSFDLEE